ncbi:MAG: hypothetical protein JST85_25535 [Acidobacteria bacterium]|nr:hypothetical protein [Acidobacteriota bacterium]
MIIGRLITTDGIEFDLESSQLTALTEHLRRQQVNDSLAAAADLEASSFFDPEEYERIVQAVYFVRQQKTLSVVA